MAVSMNRVNSPRGHRATTATSELGKGGEVEGRGTDQ